MGHMAPLRAAASSRDMSEAFGTEEFRAFFLRREMPPLKGVK